MSIADHFDRRIIIQRPEVVSGNKRQFVSTGTIDAHIQMQGLEYGSKAPQVYGATYKAWCDVNENVVQGDRVEDEDGVLYNVVTVNRQQHGSQEHLELILKRYIE